MRIIVHRSEIALMMSPVGEIGRGAARAAGKVRDRAKRYATVNTGLMRNSIFATLEEQGLYSITWRIGTPVDYAIYQEEGTGPIFARRAPILTYKIGNRWISTYSTSGVPAVRFLTRAIELSSIEDFG
jgi:hypothetical protein